MPSLMDIPRELRDKICTEVLTPFPRPDITEPFDSLTKSRVKFQKPRIPNMGSGILYDPQNLTINIPSLLFVNRQLNHETLSTIRRLSKTPIFEIDLIIADEIVLLPTWLLVPGQHTTAFNTVNVTFRIAGYYDKDRRYPFRKFYWGFADGDDRGPATGFELCSMLRDFLRTGLRGDTERGATNPHVTAKCIRFDVQTLAGIGEEQFVSPQSRLAVWRKRYAHGDVLDPNYLLQFVKRYLDGLLRTNRRDWFDCGRVLYEHVDEVVLCKDGVEVTRWDVADCMKGREIDDVYLTAEGMRKYKLRTWKLRRSNGLKVFEN